MLAGEHPGAWAGTDDRRVSLALKAFAAVVGDSEPVLTETAELIARLGSPAGAWASSAGCVDDIGAGAVAVGSRFAAGREEREEVTWSVPGTADRSTSSA